ncbi:NYN domain-containing protein [Candidatus Lucifugimonas marina]|uniref:NYN domain-containing protein n=1 Tax=Candidatus Lucifugimonas marina TaxID=3038979 RepID=A0AAJ6CT49_9CHLR|nr:NYN domain-containing protein [SAR202 cluster bacterium JH702]MDG0870424.1 NYN domain-containing protein [SAR202 cluster bacterium JH639]WFG36024.1 NYN domain-containing protein [SAR202 cluster bacterium JH545]WFG39968.1 NYN domain-containing protein [SAR202 cluster bacterium JH1073]
MPSKSSKVSTQRESDRVMVFIDGSNLYHVLSQQCGRHDLQFDKFAQKLANGRKLQRIYYYNIRQESESNPNVGVEQSKFLDSLYDTPYVEVRLGIWKQRGDIMVEKGVDVMLATDVVTNAYNDHYDTAIVVSGDADFYPALQAAKDVGKHIEVAAFDMNLSAESARVADVVQKLNKTFFTGLWMTRAQARSRSAASSRPEVSDEAASPNGEDKAATKAATSRRSSTRKTATSAAGTKTRRIATTRARKPATRRSAAATASEKEDVAAESTTETKMRRTPTRRRVGGSSSSNGTSNGRSAPKPPALRKSSAAESKTESKAAEKTAPKPEPKKETADAEPVGSATRRRNWRGRLGLNNNEEE